MIGRFLDTGFSSDLLPGSVPERVRIAFRRLRVHVFLFLIGRLPRHFRYRIRGRLCVLFLLKIQKFRSRSRGYGSARIRNGKQHPGKINIRPGEEIERPLADARVAKVPRTGKIIRREDGQFLPQRRGGHSRKDVRPGVGELDPREVRIRKQQQGPARGFSVAVFFKEQHL